MNTRMFTPDLFEEPVARKTDPITSHEAAADATMRASHGRLLALRTLFNSGPLTDFELAARTGWQQTSIGKRRGECFHAGLVEADADPVSGDKRKRPAPSGSMALVWRITKAGIAFLNEQEP